jgi:hypothetical protein
MALLARLEADLNVEIAQKLLEKFPNGANSAGMAIEQGYAKRDGDRVVTRIEFNHGELKINGKVEALPGMGGPPGGAPPIKSEVEEPPPAAHAAPKPGSRRKAE